MRDFSYHAPTAVYFGCGCIEKHRRQIASYGKKAFIITSRFGSGFENLALADVQRLFDAEGVECVVYEDVEENPSVESIKKLCEIMRACAPNLIFAIGGGSALDSAKAANILIKYPAESDPYQVFYSGEPCPNTSNCGLLPSLCIPTTAGSGSEVMGFAILTRSDTQTKLRMNQLSFFEAAFLDSRYIENSPQWLLDSGAMDALAHGVEGYLNKYSSKIGSILHDYGFDLFRGYKKPLENADLQREDYEKMMAAATIQGIALLQSGTTIPHGMGYPLTHFKGVPHGLATAVTLPAFMECFSEKKRVRHVLEACGFESISGMNDFISGVFARNVDIEISREEIARWAEECSRIKYRLDRHTEPITKEMIEQIYLKALDRYILE